MWHRKPWNHIRSFIGLGYIAALWLVWPMGNLVLSRNVNEEIDKWSSLNFRKPYSRRSLPMCSETDLWLASKNGAVTINVGGYRYLAKESEPQSTYICSANKGE